MEDWMQERFDNLAAIFYKAGASYWNATISAEELQRQLLANSARLGGPYFEGANGNYSQALFTDYVDAGRIRGYNKKEIQLQKSETAIWNEAVVDKKFWGIGNELLEVPESFNYQQGLTIQQSDLEGDDKTISDKLYIGESDVADLKEEYQKAVENDEELVLLRYANTNYHSAKAIVKIQDISDKNEENRDDKLMHEWMDEYHAGNVNGYLAQQTVFLNFEIISMWFETEDAATEIPIMMTPMDVLSGLQPGVAQRPDSVGSSKVPWYIWLILAIVLVIILVVLSFFFPVLKPILSAILKAIVWIVLLPFKIIAWIGKKISEAVKKRREEKDKKQKAEPADTGQGKAPKQPPAMPAKATAKTTMTKANKAAGTAVAKATNTTKAKATNTAKAKATNTAKAKATNTAKAKASKTAATARKKK